MSAPVVALWLLDGGEHVVVRLSTGARLVRAIGQPGEAVPVLTVEVVFDLSHGAGWCCYCGARVAVPYRVGALRLPCCGGRAWPLPAWPEEGAIVRPTRRPASRRTAWRWPS
ncbi:hypothetical protein [Quadrisphaera setariae]|uniref:Uncharacterized protein n=1 Tax=Quadrisphaera setariae TaxID=2593304 RepID=A0A5C8ZHX0_9ACTN|nr:hypothetical protein [Quadrisphaera setariae]TXR56470.1 hypothetical protein FMM08_10305 [Quadrisphaera setariae]